MIAFINDIDRLLQSAAMRIVNPKNAAIILATDAPAFHLNSAGVADVDTITVTATLYDLDGPLVFSAQGATLTEVTDRSATVTYANMQGATAIITARTESGGETFSQSCIIATTQDGASGATAKVLTLSPSEQVFKISKEDQNSPDSITLTASGQNLVGTPAFTIPIGTATLSAGANASQKILTFANMATDSVTIQASLDGLADRVTIVKIREGVDGVDGLTALLTNESVTLPAGSNGVVSNYYGAVCAMRVYEGTADVTADWTFGTAPASDIDSLAYSRAGETVTVTRLAVGLDSAYVDITASRTGYPSITKRFSIAKSKAGESLAGARGAGMYFAPGTEWSDGAADSATPGGNVVGDTVTISNGSTYSMTKKWDGSAWIVMGAVFDGSLFVTNSIHGAALKVGTVEVRKPDGTLLLGTSGEFGGVVTARNLRVGSPDNIVPDPRFKDLKWWGVEGENVAVGNWEGLQTFWSDHASLYIYPTPLETNYSAWFPVEKGARYRFESQVYLHPDFAGQFGIYLHVEGVNYDHMGQPSLYQWAHTGLQVQYDSNSPKGARSFSVPEYIVPSWSTGRAQFVIVRKIDAAQVEIGGIRITRVADDKLVGEGVLSARHIVGDTLDVLAAYFGSVQLGVGGALWTGQTAYDAGVGLRLGTNNADDPYFSARSGNGNFVRIRPATNTFEWNGGTITGAALPGAVLESFGATIIGNANGGGYPNGTSGYGYLQASVTGGRAPYTFQWILSQGVTNGNTDGIVMSATSGESVSFSGTGSNSYAEANVTLIVTDSNNRSTTLSQFLVVTHGVPP